MADHIRALLMEARYIQSRQEIIEVDMSDDEELDDAPSEFEANCSRLSQFTLFSITLECRS